MKEPFVLSFVVCPSFHGATLFSLLLNNHSQVSALADTNPSREYDQLCSCGEHVSACAYWQAVSWRVGVERFDRLNTLLPILPRPLEKYRLEGRELPLTGRPRLDRAAGHAAATAVDALSQFVWHPGSRALHEYAATWHSYYDAVRDLQHTSVIVDGSKSARKAELFARRINGASKVRVIHLLRDPRGFVASWFRHHGRHDIRAITWRWVDLHQRMAALAGVMPYLRIRYEDLANDVEPETTRALDFLGVPHEVVVGPPRYPNRNHLMGNDMLFGFDGTIRLDERWKSDLLEREQAEVLSAAGKLAERMGYA